MKPTAIGFLSLLVASLLLAGCSSSTDALERDPVVEGTVTQIDTEHQPRFRFLVEENPDVNKPLAQGGKKVWFSLAENSRVLIRDNDGSLRSTDPSAIRVGQKIKGWARGNELADSYPQQGVADQVIILD